MELNNKNNIGVKMSGETLDIFIYDEITKEPKINWCTWDIEESECSSDKIRELLEENKGVTAINIYINSCGGDVYEAYAIASLLSRQEAYKTVYIDGIAASAATIIPLICDKIVMATYAVQMIHNCWTCAMGNASDLRKAADDLDIIMEGARSLYMQRFHGTEEELIQLLDSETFLTAEKCIELGLCDEVVEVMPKAETNDDQIEAEPEELEEEPEEEPQEDHHEKDQCGDDEKKDESVNNSIEILNSQLSRQLEQRTKLKKSLESIEMKKLKKEPKKEESFYNKFIKL